MDVTSRGHNDNSASYPRSSRTVSEGGGTDYRTYARLRRLIGDGVTKDEGMECERSR